MHDRWLHIRQPAGFSDEMFDIFRASAEVFIAHANALLAVYRRLPGREKQPELRYEFGTPELSEDRTIASLRISGGNTLLSRSDIEIGCCYMLWQHFPGRFMEGLEQGRTEEGATEWWAPWPSVPIPNSDPEFRRRFLR